MNTAVAAQDLLQQVKPRLRGWIHLVTAPLVLIVAIVLLVLAPSLAARLTTLVFMASALQLFTVSAVYHLGSWSPRTGAILRRIDHTNILFLIAGTYTPISWLLLPQPEAILLLSLVWAGAFMATFFRIFWLNAPRMLYTPIYVVLGLAATLFLPSFFAANLPAAILICAGGAAYIAGAVFYALKRPNISPTWFGFHELFHALTVVGFICHLVAVFFAVLA
ncbi:PAQR family membrane homeostasis protein TrhA [Micrococcoides hystricis]|uniref:Hemolysin III family protein n=1 Tax=Micrococcoides hystricis TaxID=1572761 RepID=A0ABV6PA67_9MICC